MKPREKILYSIIFILPFIRGMYFLHTTYIVAALGLLLLLINIKHNKEMRIPCDVGSYFLYIIILMYGVSFWYAVDRGMSFLGLLKFFTIFIYYLLFNQLSIDERLNIKRIFMIAGITMAIISIISVFIPSLKILTFQNDRLGGFIQYANTFALYMLIIYMLILDDKNNKWLLFLPIVIGCIYLSYSRSIYIISIIVFIISLFIYPKERLKILFIIPTSILIAYLFSNLGQVSKSIERIKDMSLQVSEWQSRLIYYFDALKIIKNNPFGTGYMGYFYLQRIYQSGIYYVKFVHSSIIQTCLDVGLIGMISFIFLFSINIFNRKLNIRYRIILIIIIFHSLIDFDLQFTFIWVVIVLILSLKDNYYKVIYFRKVYDYLIYAIFAMYIYFFVVTGAFYLNRYNIAYSMYPCYTEAGVKLVEEYKKIDQEIAAKLSKQILNHNDKIYSINTFLRDYYKENNYYYISSYFAKKAVELYPLNITDLEKYIETLLILVKSDIIEQGIKKDKLIEIITIEDYINTLIEGLNIRAFQVKHIPDIKMTPNLLQFRDEAKELYQVIYEEGDKGE